MADDKLQYTLSVVPTLNGIVYPATSVTSGQSDSQTALPVQTFQLAPGASKVLTPPADGKGMGLFADHRFEVRFRAGGASAPVPLFKFPATLTPGAVYSVGFFLPGICSQVVARATDLDDTTELLAIGLA